MQEKVIKWFFVWLPLLSYIYWLIQLHIVKLVACYARKTFEKSLKGSLHTAIFLKYTELLQLKNIFRIFWNYFWNILEINVFQNKNQSLYKKRGCFLKIADIDNNKLMGLLTIAGGSLLLWAKNILKKREIKEESSNKKDR